MTENISMCVVCGKQYVREKDSMIYYCSRLCLVKHTGYDPPLKSTNENVIDPVEKPDEPIKVPRFESLID